MKEVARTKEFTDGDAPCIRCGKTLHFYYNGGELDENVCCGLLYRTEIQSVDMVAYEIKGKE